MTGIERLRELVKDYRSGHECEGIECGELSCGECIAKNVLEPIATQIEREHAEDCYRMVLDHGTVSRVASEMERHVLGHEGMEDSPVARWARELRAALGATMSRHESDGVADSPYDAYEWVEAHDGLDAVKRRWECLSYYVDPVPRACMERRLASRQRQIDESHAALRRRNERIAELEHERDELREMVRSLNALTDEMEKRLMPEGMEWLVEAWPRFEDDVPLKFGDIALIDGEADMVEAVQLWIHGRPVIYGDNGSQQLERGERVQRPTPKVLDADGVEIRVGDTVWFVDESLEDFRPHIISEVKNDLGLLKTETVRFEDCAFPYPASSVTHRAPVLAADGRPLREGEKPYRVDNGKQVEIRRIDPSNGESCVFVCVDGRSYGYWMRPGQLTHQFPESWKRLEEDADRTASLFDAFDSDASADIRDLVRRAKKLAERDA